VQKHSKGIFSNILVIIWSGTNPVDSLRKLWLELRSENIYDDVG